jgi:hypothetical protein
VSKTVGEFYRLRGKVVHGLPQRHDLQKDIACANAGLEICARVLREIVSLNDGPVLSEWELSGGRPRE